MSSTIQYSPVWQQDWTLQFCQQNIAGYSRLGGLGLVMTKPGSSPAWTVENTNALNCTHETHSQLISTGVYLYISEAGSKMRSSSSLRRNTSNMVTWVNISKTVDREQSQRPERSHSNFFKDLKYCMRITSATAI